MCSITEAIESRPEAEIACIIKNYRNPSDAVLYLDDGFWSTRHPIYFSEEESLDELRNFDGLKLVTSDYLAYQMRVDIFDDTEFIPFDEHQAWCVSIMMIERLKKEARPDMWEKTPSRLKRVTRWMRTQLIE